MADKLARGTGIFFLAESDHSGHAALVIRSLKMMNGVRNVKIDYITDKVHVKYDPRKVTPDQIRFAIKKASYEVL